MAGLMDRRLHDQAQSLRGVMAVLEQASRRAAGLGSDPGWLGPASAAYDVAVATLRLELNAAEVHLGAALRDTISAIGAGSSNAGESCGG